MMWDIIKFYFTITLQINAPFCIEKIVIEQILQPSKSKEIVMVVRRYFSSKNSTFKDWYFCKNAVKFDQIHINHNKQ